MFITEFCTLPRFTLTNLSPRTLFSHSASASGASGLAGAIRADKLDVQGGTIEISNSSSKVNGGAPGFVALRFVGFERKAKTDRSFAETFLRRS